MGSSPMEWWLIFTSYDPVVWLYVVCLALLFAADIRYGIAVRVARVFTQEATAEDSVLTVGLISNLLFLILDFHYGYFSRFVAIVDSYDVRYDILRWKIIGIFLLVSLGGAPIMGLLCGVPARRRGMRFLKWCALGALSNVLALWRLLTLHPVIPARSDGHVA